MRALLIIAIMVMSSCVPEQKTDLVFSSHGANSGLVGSNEKYSVSLQISERGYVSDTLKKVFNVASGTAADLWIDTNVYNKVDFGGGCDFYAESEISSTQPEFPSESCGIFGTVQPATNNSMRFSYTNKTCEYLTNQENYMNEVKTKITGTGAWKSPDEASVKKAWSLFYPADNINKEVSEALINLKSVANSDAEAWKLILFTVCSSPGWQVH